MALVIGACAAPISTTRVDTNTAHRELTRNVLSAGELSTFSRIVLNRADFHGRFEEDPEAVLKSLHAEVASGRRGANQLFALAELSFLHAQRGGGRPYYLAAAIYAYAYLFRPTDQAPPDPHDPRYRDACDLYNRALTAGLQSTHREVKPAAGILPLPFGEIELAFDPAQLHWADRQLTGFTPMADVEVKGLRNRYRRPGLGAPLAASTAPGATGQGLEIPPRVKVPVTAFLRLEEPWRQLGSTRLHATLELYATDDTDSVRVDGRRVPLEAEPTAVLAYGLGGSRAWDFELGGFLSGDFLRAEKLSQLFALHPYRRGRIPVVFVHGTASSPARWAEMFNELENDPRIGSRYQFWFFMYETGNPILYSAVKLRESLEKAVATVDPDGTDSALRRMVLIGHSQGGLLVKLMAVDLESQIREAYLSAPLEDLRVSEDTRDLLRRTVAVRPLSFVHRVIFIATPQRGSYMSGRWLAHQLGRLVRLPGTLSQASREALSQLPQLAASSEGRLGSVYAMTPGSPLIKLLAPTPLAHWVSSHSIIPVKGDGPVAQGDDGVVKYASAHIDGVESELVVRSGHSVQANPEAVQEVRRILIEHAAQPD